MDIALLAQRYADAELAKANGYETQELRIIRLWVVSAYIKAFADAIEHIKGLCLRHSNEVGDPYTYDTLKDLIEEDMAKYY